MQADNEDFELKQMRDMAATKKRWDALIRDRKIKPLTPTEAGYAIQLSNKTLLDAWVKGSTWIPIFDVGDKFDVGTLYRKIMGFTMGGWWSGVPTLAYNKYVSFGVTSMSSICAMAFLLFILMLLVLHELSSLIT
ncbi:hypothetical protein RchiOBHm_Chr2g0119491 [Rosa chinensis]|uniref:Uncharacterized protein n=1 Tax=Rosa chinensis TaxID=74649 RepID=A0A2P6RS09_ROSCH|nr:hypothetical protein RchiOBHm_Chr2g0119491 [Rosa chinensis]